ncbi:conserved protein of unknown function [Agreia sp. COWG]|nr:conserved protein of unknown function [Agreia sp. COWG]
MWEGGPTVQRDRRQPIPDPRSGTTKPGPWAEAEAIDIENAFIGSTSSDAPADATRSQIITAKSLYLTDPDADVLPGDRIRAGSDTYFVHVRPAADTNPFTGWQPVVEIPLENTEG